MVKLSRQCIGRHGFGSIQRRPRAFEVVVRKGPDRAAWGTRESALLRGQVVAQAQDHITADPRAFAKVAVAAAADRAFRVADVDDAKPRVAGQETIRLRRCMNCGHSSMAVALRSQSPLHCI